jgi:hypothetical protein
VTPPYAVRPVRADEWRESRALRLEALAADEHWQEQARSSSVDAGPDATARLFVAVTADGDWVGSVVALVERDGDGDVGGGLVSDPAGFVATGAQITAVNGPELEMEKPLSGAASVEGPRPSPSSQARGEPPDGA